MIDIWTIGKALTKKQYSEAFKSIHTVLIGLQNDSEQNNFSDTVELLQVLHKTFREHHMLNIIRKVYNTLEI